MRVRAVQGGVMAVINRPWKVTKTEDMALVDLDGVTFPVMTLAGVITRPPVSGKGGCDKCAVREACRKAVLARDFALCERPIARELLPANGRGDRASTSGNVCYRARRCKDGR